MAGEEAAAEAATGAAAEAGTGADIGSIIGGAKNITGVFRNIFSAFHTIAGYLIDLGLTETQAWASIVVLILALFIIASKYITRFAIVLVIIVALFILATIFGVI